MALVTTTEMFKKAYDGGYAIGAFNVNNMEIVQGITEAAGELKSPVILQVSKGARAYANHTYLVKLVEAAVIEKSEPPAEEHADKELSPRVLYDFGSRYVDSRGSDLDLWRKYVRSVLSREDTVTSYGHYQGEPELRQQLAHYGMLLRGVNTTADRIFIGAGVQPLLSLICETSSMPVRWAFALKLTLYSCPALKLRPP